MITFDEFNHIYYNIETKERYTSVTTVIGKYKTKFDSIKIATKFLEKNKLKIGTIEFSNELINKYKLNLTVEEFINTPLTVNKLIEYWNHAGDVGRNRGNKYHFEKEVETIYNETKLPLDYNDSLLDLSNLKDGTYPELRLYNHKYKIAGTVDKVIIIKPYVYIFDYKTMKDAITKNNYGKFMKFPINFIPDANYYHYKIQMAIYSWILEQYGYIIKENTIIHKRFLDDEEIKDEDRIMWKSEEEQRKPTNIPYPYTDSDNLLIKNLLHHHLINAI